MAERGSFVHGCVKFGNAANREMCIGGRVAVDRERFGNAAIRELCIGSRIAKDRVRFENATNRELCIGGRIADNRVKYANAATANCAWVVESRMTARTVKTWRTANGT